MSAHNLFIWLSQPTSKNPDVTRWHSVHQNSTTTNPPRTIFFKQCLRSLSGHTLATNSCVVMREMNVRSTINEEQLWLAHDHWAASITVHRFAGYCHNQHVRHYKVNRCLISAVVCHDCRCIGLVSSSLSSPSPPSSFYRAMLRKVRHYHDKLSVCLSVRL